MTHDFPKTADVVIVGGGVMGTSTAYHLAHRGVRNVVLVEKEPFFGVMSTGQCAGGIRHQFSSEINIRLSLESIRMLERFPEEMGQDVVLRFIGYYFLLTNEEDVAADVDLNVVMTGAGGLVEVQGTAEGDTFDRKQLDRLLDLADAGIKHLVALQQEALEA